jgi:hypothetical protein
VPGTNYAIVVASPREKTGKTLLARALAEHLVATGASFDLFETDPLAPRLSAHFPQRAALFDLERVRDQMRLFDRMALPTHEIRVVDLSARAYGKFFELLRETDFVMEARARQVETVICYIPGRDADSYAHGLQVRDRFADCTFVVVDNEAITDLDRDTRIHDAYWTMKKQPLLLRMPRLDTLFSLALEESKLPLGEFLRGAPPQAGAGSVPLALLSPHVRGGIQRWTRAMLAEIERLMRALAARVPAPVPLAADAAHD